MVRPFAICAPERRIRAAPGAAIGLMIAGVLGLATAHASSRAEGPFPRTVKAVGFDERCLRLQMDEAIVYDFAADGAVDFNVHYHRDREVFYPVRQPGVRSVDSERFVASATGDGTYLKIPNARVAQRSGRMQGGARGTVAVATAKRANAADARLSGQPFGAGIADSEIGSMPDVGEP
jgi:hypothetical protein